VIGVSSTWASASIVAIWFSLIVLILFAKIIDVTIFRASILFFGGDPSRVPQKYPGLRSHFISVLARSRSTMKSTKYEIIQPS
jgi:hypothetical protein